MMASEMNHIFIDLAVELDCPVDDLIRFHEFEKVNWIDIGTNILTLVRALKKQLGK